MESFKKIDKIEQDITGISIIEATIKEILPIKEIIEIFGERTYLIGGVIRDLILGKNVLTSDLDLMTRSNVDEVLERLAQMGYSRSKVEKFKEGEFSMKENTGVINLVISGRKIQVGFKGETTVEDLIQSGDINLNCCAYDIGNGRIINSEYYGEVLRRELKFCNPEIAVDNVMIIISALKQISRIPDLIIPPETDKVIRQSIPSVVEFFKTNKDRRHKLAQIFCNINTTQAMAYFQDYDVSEIFNELETKRFKIEMPVSYISRNIGELSEEDKEKISKLIQEKFGKRFIKEKLFNSKVNSVVYRLVEDNPVACCLMDGERMYLATAINTEEIISIVRAMSSYNYNIWTTITASHRLLIKLSQNAGLSLVNDPIVLEKIMINYNSTYEGRLVFKNDNGILTFTKKNSDDQPQVLLRS